MSNNIVVTTSHYLESCKIVEYKGIVNGDSLVAASIVKDIFAGLRDFFGGRSNLYTSEMNKARIEAGERMQKQAFEIGANAIIAADIKYLTIGKNNSMIMVNMSGTAVFAIENEE